MGLNFVIYMPHSYIKNTLPYPNNIYHMAACTYEVRTLRDGLLIFYEKGEGFVAHTIKACTHVIGSTIRRKDSNTAPVRRRSRRRRASARGRGR